MESIKVRLSFGNHATLEELNVSNLRASRSQSEKRQGQGKTLTDEYRSAISVGAIVA